MLHFIFISLLIPLPLIQVGGFSSGLYLYHVLSFIMLGLVVLKIKQNNLILKFDKPDFLLFLYVLFVFAINGMNLDKEWMIALLSFFCFYISALYALNSNFSIKDVYRVAPYYLLIISLLGVSNYLNGNYLYVNPYILTEVDADGFVFTGFLGLTRGSIGVIFPVLISICLIDLFKRNTKDKILIYIAIYMAVFCVVLSGSRTGAVLCILAILLNLIFLKSKNISSLVFWGLLILFSAFPFIYNYVDFGRFSDISSSSSVVSRQEIQGATLIFIFNNIDKFVFGLGYNSNGFMRLIQQDLTHPHNEYLLTFWSLGIVGLIIFFTIFLKNYLNCANEYKKNLIIIYILIFAGSMSVGGVLTPSLRLAYFGFFGYFLFKSFRKENL